MPSPFRTNPSLGPNLSQVVIPGSVWYDNPNVVSPKVGDTSMGDDGHLYVFVQASASIAAAASPGTVVIVTEPAMTAAAGAGAFNSLPSSVYATAIPIGARFWARKTAI